jgi:ribonuclease BN (tRNA processing enzyme)
LRIKFLGTHNTESRTTKLISYLIDGMLAIDAGSIPSELTFSEQQQLKAIFLTHGHYDHIRGLPAFAFANTEFLIPVFGTTEALDILRSHLLDGIIYPKLAEKDSFLGKPVLDLTAIEPFETIHFEGYQITAIKVNHPRGAIGYNIKAENGHSIFCAGDTGPGLSGVWTVIRPDTLIMDVTFPNELATVAEESSHLCPELLMNELEEFQRIHNYFPRVISIHLTPDHEMTIKKELAVVSQKLNIQIDIAQEGEEFYL